MITYELVYPKCALTGKMIFPGDASVKGHDGRIYSDAVALRLGECDVTDIDASLIEPWLSHAELEPAPEADPITLGVIRGGLRSIWTEMQYTMTRTAYSPIFFEGEDFTVTILDPDLQIVSTREGFPSQMGAMQQFDRTHRQLYGFDLPNHQHEVLAIRVAAIGPTVRADELMPRRSTENRGTSAGGPERRYTRQMWNELASQYTDCPVFFRDDIRTGDKVYGPATIEGADSAVWIPKGATAQVDSLGNVDIELQEV